MGLSFCVTAEDDTHDDTRQPSQQAPGQDAASLFRNDTCITNISAALKYYQSIVNDAHFDELLCTYMEEEQKSLIDDYNQIVQTYGQKHSTFEEIVEFMTSQEIVCNIQTCKQYARNNRDRDTQTVPADVSNTERKQEQYKTVVYTDLMDNLHVYFLHAFDIGFRLRQSQLDDAGSAEDDAEQKLTNDELDVDIEAEEALRACYTDDRMKRYNSFFAGKRYEMEQIRGAERTEKNKFMTTTAEDTVDAGNVIDASERETKQSDVDGDGDGGGDDAQLDSYSFGYRYDYWSKYQAARTKVVSEAMPLPAVCDTIHSWYHIERPKHQNLKAEVLSNGIHQLDMAGYQCAAVKAQMYHDTSYVRSIRATNILYQFYNIERHSKMNMQHLLAIIFYTDFSALSYHFSSTFRRMDNNDQKTPMKEWTAELVARNQEFWHWSKALREVVEVFGTRLNARENVHTTFYHGVSHLIFSKVAAKFAAPTSTTTTLAVALLFAKDDGIILELEEYTGSGSNLTFFDVGRISTFAHEDEKLFFGGRNPVRLASIRSVADAGNYRIFIRALTLFQLALKGQNNTIIKKPKKMDYAIMTALCKHLQSEGVHKQHQNQFPPYINKVFRNFADDKMLLMFNFDFIKNRYKGVMKVFGVKNMDLLQFDFLAKTFQQCTDIFIVECAVHNPEANVQTEICTGDRTMQSSLSRYSVHFTDEYVQKLLQILQCLNDINNSCLTNIQYRNNVSFADKVDQPTLVEKYQPMFQAINWSIIFIEEKNWNSGSSHLWTVQLQKGFYPDKIANYNRTNSVSIAKQADWKLIHNDAFAPQVYAPITGEVDIDVAGKDIEKLFGSDEDPPPVL